jgi:hypothetical protein
MKPYEIHTGICADRPIYQGDSVFFAGLAIARAQRDGEIYCGVRWFGDCCDCDSTGITAEESEFFEYCQSLGDKFRSRKVSK